MVTAAAKQPELMPAESEKSTVPARAAAPTADAVLMFERLATDPNVDVTKLEKLIEMQERILRHQAKASFDAAFAEMQGDLPVINERGAILVNGELRSKYAKYEDIQAACRPVLQRHGFSIRHRNEGLPDGRLKIIGILSHRDGHSEQDEFICPADKSGGKQDIQAIGSTRSYGMRYTTIALLNIETRGLDDDGRKAGAPVPVSTAPVGFEPWVAALEGVASEGIAALTKTFNRSKDEFRKHLLKNYASDWAALKARAQKGGR